jgi:D-alanyl-D-alanine carboxypeptidase
MKLFQIQILIACILLLSCKNKNRINTDEPSLDSITIEQIDSIGQAFIDLGGVMGLTIAVAKEGSIVYNRGFGYIDSTKTKPVKDYNYFLMASISKLVGATMTLKLVEEKKLSLDQTLYELLPDYPNKEQAKKINLRQLLNHTSGLKDYAEVIDSLYTKTGVDPTIADYYDFFR